MMIRAIVSSYELLNAGVYTHVLINKPSDRYLRFMKFSDNLEELEVDMRKECMDPPKKKHPSIETSSLPGDKMKALSPNLQLKVKSYEQQCSFLSSQMEKMKDIMFERWCSMYDMLEGGGVSEIKITKQSWEYEQYLFFMDKKTKAQNQIRMISVSMM